MISLRYKPLPSSFYQQKRDELARQLPASSLVIIHSNDVFPTNADGTFNHHQNANFFYLTGVDQEESILLMHIGENGKHEDILLLRETNAQIAIWEGAKLEKQEGTELSGITDVRWTDEYQALITKWMPQAKEVWLERDNHPRRLTYVQTRNERMAAALQANYPDATLKILYPVISEMRMIKTEEEIDQIRQACRSTGEGFIELLGQLKAGMGEWEIEGILSSAFIRRRSRGFSFTPIVAGGGNACVLHYITNHMETKDGDLVLLDIGAEYGGYAGDMTRTVPLNGKYSPRQKEVYEACLAVYNQAKKLMKPGVRKVEYERAVRCCMAQQLLGLGLISEAEIAEKPEDPPAVRRYFMHGTSHSLGIDVHDVGAMDTSFAVNQVWTIEPGIYIKEENIGIRIETDVVVREEGVEDLLEFVPVTVEDIESHFTKTS